MTDERRPRNRGWWWLLGAIGLIAVLLVLLPVFRDADVVDPDDPLAPGVASENVADPATLPVAPDVPVTRRLGSIAEILDAERLADLDGDPVTLDPVVVTEVRDRRTIVVGDGENRQILVVIADPAAESLDLSTGAAISLQGVVRRTEGATNGSGAPIHLVADTIRPPTRG